MKQDAISTGKMGINMTAIGYFQKIWMEKILKQEQEQKQEQQKDTESNKEDKKENEKDSSL